MADSSGRTEAEQRAHLESQTQQNNLYAELYAQGFQFDGAYFDGSALILQAPAGSSAANAARSAGLEVRDPEHGQSELRRITAELTAQLGHDDVVVSIAPDVARDVVVLTVSEATVSIEADIEAYGDAVVVAQGEPQVAGATFTGGDKMILNDNGNWCSAGFPATDDAGADYMIWVGHCVEDTDTLRNASGAVIAYGGETEYTSYYGRGDKDIGFAKVAPGSDITSAINDYSSGRNLDAGRGTWTPPVGTDLCKSGSTTGITCGKVTGYDATVNYEDHQGRHEATVSGLATSTVCFEGGDSGGAYVAGGYGVGMMSGGPLDQSCGGFNQGYVPDTMSYFQPLEAALDVYGFSYAG